MTAAVQGNRSIDAKFDSREFAMHVIKLIEAISLKRSVSTTSSCWPNARSLNELSHKPAIAAG
jgi:hypothetical protein